MITFRFLPIKYERSRCTQIFFCLLIMFLLFTHFTVIIPETPANAVSYAISVIHIILFIIVLITYFWTGCKDPGYLQKQYQLGHLLENFHSDDICPRCEVLTTPRSHHCSICDRCVECWDHHCPWINNCVGVKNHRSFFVFMFSTTLLFIVYIEPPITAALSYTDKDIIDIYSRFCVGCNIKPYRYTIYIITVLIALFGSIILAWIL